MISGCFAAQPGSAARSAPRSAAAPPEASRHVSRSTPLRARSTRSTCGVGRAGGRVLGCAGKQASCSQTAALTAPVKLTRIPPNGHWTSTKRAKLINVALMWLSCPPARLCAEL